MKLTIQDLAKTVNNLLIKEDNAQYDDGRKSQEVSERRIRDYMSKGLLAKPFGTGKDKWFEQTHVDQLMALRKLQGTGLSDKYLITASSSAEPTASASFGEMPIGNSCLYKADDAVDKIGGLTSQQESTLNFLADLSKTRGIQVSSGYRTTRDNLSVLNASKSYASSLAAHTQNAISNNQDKLKVKSFKEYQITADESVYVKLDSSIKDELAEKIIAQVKGVVGNYIKSKN